MENILLVDDHPMIRLGMEFISKKVIPDANLYFSNTYEEALEEIQCHKMSLIILDLGIPGGIGLSMVRAFRQVQQNVRILICTGRDELTNAAGYFEVGVNGFLQKNSPEGELEKAIRTVMEDEKYMSRRIQKVMLDNMINKAPACSNPVESLSPREKQVLGYMLAGKWIKEIASELNINFSTVSSQKAKIFQKLKVNNMVDLVRKVDSFTNS